MVLSHCLDIHFCLPHRFCPHPIAKREAPDLLDNWKEQHKMVGICWNHINNTGTELEAFLRNLLMRNFSVCTVLNGPTHLRISKLVDQHRTSDSRSVVPGHSTHRALIQKQKSDQQALQSFSYAVNPVNGHMLQKPLTFPNGKTPISNWFSTIFDPRLELLVKMLDPGPDHIACVVQRYTDNFHGAISFLQCMLVFGILEMDFKT